MARCRLIMCQTRTAAKPNLQAVTVRRINSHASARAGMDSLTGAAVLVTGGIGLVGTARLLGLSASIFAPRAAPQEVQRLAGGVPDQSASREMAGAVIPGDLRGFIGSHTVLSLLSAGCRVVIIDNLHNAHLEALRRVKALAGHLAGNIEYQELDLKNAADLDALFCRHVFQAVIHFAGLKAVGESVARPMLYYTNNFVGTVNLIEAMAKHNCKRMVFSSSCTVYGNPQKLPIDEDHPLGPISPYGRSKAFIEDMLRDVCRSDPLWSVLLLRYFNPISNHPTGDLGESPVDTGAPPNNLLPYIQQVVTGRRNSLTVFGTDYNTVDGTPVRDYIHVVDLAEGHRAALAKVMQPESAGCTHYNLGTGVGSSVLQVLKACERACGKTIPYELADRRPGDAEAVFAGTALAEKELGWKATYTLDDMCSHMWAWMQKNPNGYAGGDDPQTAGI